MIVNFVCVLVLLVYVIMCILVAVAVYAITITLTRIGGRIMFKEKVELTTESILKLMHEAVRVLDTGTHEDKEEIKEIIINTFSDRKSGRVPEVSNVTDVEDDELVTVSYSFIDDKKISMIVPKSSRRYIIPDLVLNHFITNFEEYQADMLHRIESTVSHNKFFNNFSKTEKSHDCGCDEECKSCKCKK